MRLAVVGSVAALTVGAGTWLPTAPAGAAAAGTPIKIVSLSTRADLVSWGVAYVQVQLPSGVTPSSVKLTLNGRDVSKQFAIRPNGKFEAFLPGLGVGSNLLVARTPDGHGARLTIRNSPQGGPVFSGPQIQPWTCLPGSSEMNPPRNAKCERQPKYVFKYKPVIGTGFQDYDPSNPPPEAAVQQTTTDQGRTVPYIVRVENGSLDRGTYQIAVLSDPEKPWPAPWAPQPTWNRKLEIPGGSSCGTRHGQGGPNDPDVMVDRSLSKGFMVATTSLADNGQNCNLVVQAESLIMLKERIQDQYGLIRYTIGSGCSGGSIYQQQDTNAYPGILDGMLPNCSYPDNWSTAQEVEDCALLQDYFESPAAVEAGLTPSQRAKIEGHSAFGDDPNTGPCVAWSRVFQFNKTVDPKNSGFPNDCGVPDDKVYDPRTNFYGVRCSTADYSKNALGTHALTVDGKTRQVGNRPYDNVGVQYGLDALRTKAITEQQFADLNAKIGSHDIDYFRQTKRVAADPGALQVVYRTGLVNEANNLGDVPIIDLRGHDVEEIHHDYWSRTIRARLDRWFGDHRNQVIWTGPIPLVGTGPSTPGGSDEAGSQDFKNQAFFLMDSWLAAIEADTSTASKRQKVLAHKPAAAKDTCFEATGRPLPDQSQCNTVYPVLRTPRIVAGGPTSGDHIKCALKPLVRSDYPVDFNDQQWAQLKATFPTGVCDFSKPAPHMQKTVPWLTYSTGPGGTPLGPPPQSVAF